MTWLQIVWIAVMLGVLVMALRSYQLGARRMIVMALAWLFIFMIAAGIATFFVDGSERGDRPQPRSDAPLRLT